MKRAEGAHLESWLVDPLDPLVERSVRALAAAKGVVRLAIMPDVHLARDVCVGVVAATDSILYPAAVGGDIGCGMAAVAFDCHADLLADERRAARLLSALYEHVPSNKHRHETAISRLPAELDEAALGSARLERMKRREGRVQLGTLGRGNHFLELQRDEERRLWLMLHSGSRAIGQAIRDHHLARATSDSALPYLEADSEAGRSYRADQLWAISYAELNRARMVERVCELMLRLFSVSAAPGTLFQCHHNHVQQEVHFGRRLWVHRKGALDAREGARGMIPGSMGSPSYHVTGRGHEPALRSSSHGAGRRMSRGEARRRVHPRKLAREMSGVLFDQRIARKLCDEAPSAYREIGKVMRAQRELTRIDRKLWPILSYKGA